VTDPRLLIIVGKGGVGRTTVAAGLALEAGHRGLKVLVLELNGLWDIGRRMRLARSYPAIAISENVDWRSLTARECMEDFGKRKLKLGFVGSSVMGSRPLRAFVDAVPGLPDLLQLGKIENLLNDPLPGDPVYDLVIVDAPATGHGVTLLSAPQSMTEISGAGPFHDLASTIADALAAPSSGVVVATLPEVLPLSETLGLLDQLEAMPIRTHRVVVNRVAPLPIPDLAQWPQIKSMLSDEPDLVRLADLTEGLLGVHAEEHEVLATLTRRAEQLRVPVSLVPTLPRRQTRVDLEAVATALGAR